MTIRYDLYPSEVEELETICKAIIHYNHNYSQASILLLRYTLMPLYVRLQALNMDMISVPLTKKKQIRFRFKITEASALLCFFEADHGRCDMPHLAHKLRIFFDQNMPD